MTRLVVLSVIGLLSFTAHGPLACRSWDGVCTNYQGTRTCAECEELAVIRQRVCDREEQELEGAVGHPADRNRDGMISCEEATVTSREGRCERS